MDADSDHDPIQLGRHHASSSSRESSPAAKRPRHSFTPTSDDGDLVAPATHDDEDTETPTPEHAPLLRQAVGFSSYTDANVSTYQAIAPAQPVVLHFLPGQAPPPPPKPKPCKPRAPRKKKGVQFSDQTGKFKLSNTSSLQPSSVPGFAGISLTETSPDSSSSRATRPAVWRPMLPTTSASGGHATQDSNVNMTMMGVASITPPPGAKRPRKSSSKKRINAPAQNPPSVPTPTPASTSATPQHTGPVAQSVSADVQMTYSAPGGTSTSVTVNQGPSQSSSRPMRMVTLLIEDLRSGVPDAQLAEVRVPLKIADDPEDGFWGDAVDICNALQSGPARVDGPAKVYTKRGRFRQFFMRVDQLDQFEVQQANLGVSKERTLNVFVEAPVPQGQLPRPPAPPPDPRPTDSSGSDLEVSLTGANYQPICMLPTREEQVKQLSKRSNYARAERAHSPVSESGSYGHSQRTQSPTQHRARHEYASSSQRTLTPPVPGRLADTEEEKDEAITNYIRSHIENHTGWVGYMQSRANAPRVSEVLKQYRFVEDRVRELIGQKAPAHWDGAPNCMVGKRHIWSVLQVDAEWGERCQETLDLLGYYGKEGSRYEDSRVMDMINDTSLPKPNAMDKFLRLLRSVDKRFTQDALSGRFS